jgi:lipopolysaccharide transport system permease protein
MAEKTYGFADDSGSESWTEIITPKTNLLDLRLGEVWKYKDLLFLFVRRDFIAQYKQTVLGPLWHIIQPLFTTIIFLFLFGRIASIPTDGIKPVLFYMSGITIWNYFATCVINTSNTFLANANIFGKVYFPRLVIPLSIIISNIVRFCIQFCLLLIMMLWFEFHGTHIHFGINWMFIPIITLLVGGIGLGLGIIVSSLTTKYRDLAILLGFAVQLGMYATPIAYPLSFLKQKGYGSLIGLNPLSPLVECFRYCLFGYGTFSASSLIYSVIVMVIIIFLGMLIFNKVEKKFMDTV